MGRKITLDLDYQTAEVFEPLREPARTKGAHGGRGSAKSHNYAILAIEKALEFPGQAGEGLRLLCFREVQKSLKESAKFLLEQKIKSMGLGRQHGFKIYKDVIALPRDGLIAFTGLSDHTADSIKSYEGFQVAWGEEAQTITSYSMNLLRPTIRWENKSKGLASELWFSWNPRFKTDAVDMLLRGPVAPRNSIVVQSNWSDNPFFPDVLEQERLDCLELMPHNYEHIWEGGYMKAAEGAYYSLQIQRAAAERRIGYVAPDEYFTYRAFADLGGTGRKADAFALWIAQFVGRELRALNYYEAKGQELSYHIDWMRRNGYNDHNTSVWLPHDGEKGDYTRATSFKSGFEDAGYTVETVPNQGAGAAMGRIMAGRRVFPNIHFNEKPTAPGLEALGWYHPKIDDKRNIDLGPDHDWSSHCADAFGLMALVYLSEVEGEPYKGYEKDDYNDGNDGRSKTGGY